MRRNLLLLALLVLSIIQGAIAQTWNWVQQAKTTSAANDNPVKIALDSSGNTYVVARFSNLVTFGNQSLTCSGSGNLYFAKYSASGTLLFVQQFIATNFVDRYDVAVASDGEAVVVGSYTGNLDIATEIMHPTFTNSAAGAGQRSFVAKFRVDNGLARWIKQSENSGGNGLDTYASVTTDKSGAIYIAHSKYHSGTSTAAYYQLDLNGSIISGAGATPLQSGDSNAADIVVDEAGNVYLAGTYTTQVAFGSRLIDDIAYGYVRTFISKYNRTTNTWQWASKSLGAYKANYPLSINMALSGRGPVIIHTGIEQFSFDGTPLRSMGSMEKYQGVTGDRFGNVYVTGGYDVQPGRHPQDLPGFGYVRKFNRNGVMEWEKRFAKASSTDPSAGFGSDLVIVKDGTLLVGGAVFGGTTYLDNYIIGTANGSQSHFVAPLKYTALFLNLQNPIGGESYTAGNTEEIRWTTNYNGNVELSYSLDGGIAWAYLATVPAAQQSYWWKLPYIESNNCKIRIKETTDLALSQNEAPFSIRKPQLRVTAPVKGASWNDGVLYTVKFEDNVSGKYNIDLNYQGEKGMTEWQRLKLASGEWASEVPGTVNGLNQVQVRIPAELFNCEEAVSARVVVSRMLNWSTVDQQAYSDIIAVGDPNPCDYFKMKEAFQQPAPIVAEVKTGLNVYPNPVANMLHVEAGGLEEGITLVEIYSTAGVKVYSKQVPVVGGSVQSKVEVSSLAPGIYHLRIAGSKAKSQSFIKK